MNLNERIAIRNQEIEEGLNLGTRHPLYFVYSMRVEYLTGHCTDRSPTTNLRDWSHENLYVKKEWSEYPEFFEEIPSGENKSDYEKVIRIWIDDFKGLFFTHQAAQEYMKYQSHNLTNPYIYIHNAGYRNYEFETIFNK